MERTWIVKVKMSQPHAIAEAPATGPHHFTDDDVAQLHRALRDSLPFDAPRRLVNAVLEDEGIVAFFETITEPSVDECRELAGLTSRALRPFRWPARFECVKTYPMTVIDVTYLP
ncbi:MAG TPA: hypothetical protein VGX27_05535 [Candidatus Dormibacteraeota bacterium]|nr:hypothetical protein [Candidatus Dormibacteraeota bacterium]